MSAPTLSPRARYAVLFAAIGGLMFDGVELGLMPVAALACFPPQPTGVGSIPKSEIRNPKSEREWAS